MCYTNLTHFGLHLYLSQTPVVSLSWTYSFTCCHREVALNNYYLILTSGTLSFSHSLWVSETTTPRQLISYGYHQTFLWVKTLPLHSLMVLCKLICCYRGSFTPPKCQGSVGPWIYVSNLKRISVPERFSVLFLTISNCLIKDISSPWKLYHDKAWLCS